MKCSIREIRALSPGGNVSEHIVCRIRFFDTNPAAELAGGEHSTDVQPVCGPGKIKHCRICALRHVRQIRKLILIARYDLDCINAGVIANGLKCKDEFSEGIWTEASKLFLQGAVLSAGLLEYVEILQQNYTVEIHIENATTTAPFAIVRRAKVRFAQVKNRSIASLSNGDRN